MNSYYIKKRVTEKQNVSLSAVEVAQTTHILMAYPSGYLQVMEYRQFLNTLTAAITLSPDNEELQKIQRELETVILTPQKLI